VTVLFWDLKAGRFRTYSSSRPVNNPGRFDLDQVYRVESVWSGGGAPERLGRTLLLLRQARLNPAGRLSAAQSSSVEPAELTDPARLDFGARGFANWLALLGHARAVYPMGLVDRDPLDRVVMLRPATWGERFFDELQQRFTWQLIDDQGAALELALPWTEVNEPAIEFLEAVNPARDQLTGVVVRLGFGGRGLTVEPLSLLSAGTPQGHRVLNPGFDRELIRSKQSTLLEKLRQKYGRDRIAVTMTTGSDGDEDGEAAGTLDALPPGLQTRLAEAEAILLRLAESGVRRLPEETGTRLKQIALALGRAGLGELAAGFNAFGNGRSTAAGVLSCGYLCRLYRQAATIQFAYPAAL
jgi:hypothetical protein